MSESMAAEIRIGGKIPAALVPDLCEEIAQAGVALEWGSGSFQPARAKDLLEACTPGQDGVSLLRLQDDQAPWGQFESLECFLQEHGIAYGRRTEGRFEYDPEQVDFRPDLGEVVIPTNGTGEPVVPLSGLVAVADALIQALEFARAGSLEATIASIQLVQRLLQEHLPPAVPPLEPFEIVSDKTLEVEHGQ